MTDRVEGTREAKRARRAAPDPLATSFSPGCLVIVVVFLVLCVAWFAITRSAVPAVLAATAAAVLLLVLLAFLKGRFLLGRVMTEWAPRGIRCLVAHSDSPVWKEHIAAHWLPRIGAQAITFNWSRRAERAGSLEFEVFKHFCLAQRNFNPAVIVFRGLARPMVFRFFYAFREARIGRPLYLEQLEQRMFQALGL